MPQLISAKTPVKRRKHSKAFKAQVFEACNQPGVSIAAVAQRFRVNANLIHKWRRDGDLLQRLPSAKSEFLAIPMIAAQTALPQNTQVRFDVAGINVHWPLDNNDHFELK